MDSSKTEKSLNNHLGGAASSQFYQNVVVMRHGDRADNFEPLWVSSAARPWDPPLVEEGRVRAFCTGRKFRKNLAFPIHRVLVSPFLRCIQTAYEVVTALCAFDDDPNSLSSKDIASIDPSKLKVSVENGLCEMLNRQAIRIDLAPKNGNFGFNASELEALLPAGTVDTNVRQVYEKMPEWEEGVEAARERYAKIIKALADKYPSENLLLVTHGEAVGSAVSTFLKGNTVYEVDYCAYVELRRPIVRKTESFTAGEFEVVTNNGETGVRYAEYDGTM